MKYDIYDGQKITHGLVIDFVVGVIQKARWLRLKRKGHACRTMDHSSSGCLLFHVANSRLNYGSTFCSLALLLASLHVARCIVFCFFDPRSRWFTGAWQTKLRQAIRCGKGAAVAGTCARATSSSPAEQQLLASADG
jgi:hypothetical protein